MIKPDIPIQPLCISISEEAPSFLLYSLRGSSPTDFQWGCDVMQLQNPVGTQLLCRVAAKLPEEALAQARTWLREKGIYGE